MIEALATFALITGVFLIIRYVLTANAGQGSRLGDLYGSSSQTCRGGPGHASVEFVRFVRRGGTLEAQYYCRECKTLWKSEFRENR